MSNFIPSLKKEFSRHLLDYLILFTASVLFLVLVKNFEGERIKSFVSLVGFVFFYIAWGAYHHSREKTLHLKTVLEYILIGFIALFVLTITFLI